MKQLNAKVNSSFVYKIVLTFLFVVIFLMPRIIDLDVFMATDEGAWTFRAANFYYALGQREFEETYVSTHPGIITNWVGTVALLIDFPEYRGLNQGYFGDYYEYEAFLKAQGIAPFDILVTSRIVMVVFLTVVLGLCFYISLELFGFQFAAPAFFLAAFDPLFLAISRTYHLDAPMTSLILLSLLSLLLYYKKDEKPVLLLLFSGLIAGTAVLAKLTSAVYAVSTVVTIVAFPFLFGSRSREKLWGELKKIALKILLWGGSAALGMALFWPVMWVKPIATLRKLITYALGASSGDVGASSASVEPTTFFFYNPLQPSFMNYFSTFMWRTTPIVILGLAAAAACYFLKLGSWREKKFQGSLFAFLLFSIIYTIILGISVKQSQKYYLPVMLILDIIAGFGFASLPALFRKINLLNDSLRQKMAVAGTVILFVIQLLLVLPTHPYYFTYYNPMLGGPQAASKEIFVGTGEGLNLAGEYLNQKPDSQNLKVLAWYGTGCLSYFFDGEVNIIDLDGNWSKDEQMLLKESDYLVTYSNEWFRNRPAELLDDLHGITPEYTVYINRIEYARIYKVSELPKELFGN